MQMRKLSEINETYLREEPIREQDTKSEKVQRLEEFAHDKGKKAEIIKAWTELKDHPKAEDMKSDVGCAFEEGDLDEELAAAFEAIGEDGMIYSSFEGSFWIRHKGKLIRVM